MSTVEAASHAVAKEQHVQDDSLPLEKPATDDELLRRFIANRDEAAFTQLVSRHSSLVMGVCRRTLGNEQDAEDAFQATFMVLARKAATVRQGAALAAWLYQAAFRIALRARSGRCRRKEQPLEAETVIANDTFSKIASEHVQTVVDEELNRLPEKYRLPLYLCCVDGQSREEAAKKLGVSAGVLKGRLERGRQMLRRRLTLRRVSFGVAIGLLANLRQSTLAAQPVAPSLIASTAQASVQYAAGQSVVGLVTNHAISLANGSVQLMSLTSVKIVAGCLLLIGTLAAATSLTPAPVLAGGEGDTIILSADSTSVDRAQDAVAFLFDDEEGRRSDEAERERRSPEADSPWRRSPEADSPLRSPEADAPRRRSAEGDRGPRRSPEGAARDREQDPLQGFRPQTQGEAALFQMILQLHREVAAMRAEMQRMQGMRDGEGAARGPRDGDRLRGLRDGEGDGRGPRDGEGERRNPLDGEAVNPFFTHSGEDLPPLEGGWQRTKAGQIFRAYDKNGDNFVSLDEWLAMTNGNISEARRRLQTGRFEQTRPGRDSKLSPVEFVYWWSHRDGAQPRRRDDEGRRSAEEEGSQRSPEAESGSRRSPEAEDRN